MLCAILSCKIYFHCTISGSRKWDEPIASICIPLSYLRRKIGQTCRIQPNSVRTVASFSRLLD